jgi:hypothetical protein
LGCACNAPPFSDRSTRRSPLVALRSRQHRQPVSQRSSTPWALPEAPADLQASLKRLPKLSFVSGLPFSPTMKERSPQGPASSVVCSTGRIGSVTSRVKPDFSVLSLPRRCGHAGDQDARHHRGAGRYSDRVEPHSLPRPHRPARLISRHISLGPRNEANCFLAVRVANTCSRINLHQASVTRPTERDRAWRPKSVSLGVVF